MSVHWRKVKNNEEIRKGIEEIQKKAAAVPRMKTASNILIDARHFHRRKRRVPVRLVTAAGGINAAAELGSSYFELSEENIRTLILML